MITNLGMGLHQIRGSGGSPPAPLLETGQTTAYSIGDDGDVEVGLAKSYTVLSTGAYSGTSNLDVPSYAGDGIAFAATTPGTITDTGAGLAHVATGDTIVVKGSASNDGVYTVSTGGVAGTIRTTEATVLEAAGAYVSIYKRAAHSNNCVQDDETGLIWARYTSNGERVGAASAGTLNWYDATTCFTLHPAAADLQMIAASNTLRIVGGAGEIARYHVGDVLVFSGFANADNNLPNWPVASVTVNGADLDIVLTPPGDTVPVTEAAGGARDIKLVCRSIFGYAAAANAASLGGYTDWRVPPVFAHYLLCGLETPNGLPDAVAFPGWPSNYLWTSTVYPQVTTQAFRVAQTTGASIAAVMTTANLCALVRGGV